MYLGDLKSVIPPAPADLTPYTKAWTPKDRADTEAVQLSNQASKDAVVRKQKYIETYKSLDPNMNPQQKYQTLAAIDPDEANKFMAATAADHLNRVKQTRDELDAHTGLIGNMVEGWQQRNPDATTPKAKLEYGQIYKFAKGTLFGTKGLPPPEEYDFYGKNMPSVVSNFVDRNLTVQQQVEAKIKEAETRGDMAPDAQGKVKWTEEKRHNIAMENQAAAALKDKPKEDKQASMDRLNETIDKADVVRNHPGMTGAVGRPNVSSLFGLKKEPFRGSKEADFLSELNGLRSLLTLENIKAMKGMGALSDAEGAMLRKAATSMSETMSNEAFKIEADRVFAKLEEAKQRMLDKEDVTDYSKKDKYVVGKVYTDAKGNKATYRGNGKWEE
jgi:hypothetical protein